MGEDTCIHARVVQCFVGMYIHVCVSSVRDSVRGLCRNCYIFLLQVMFLLRAFCTAKRHQDEAAGLDLNTEVRECVYMCIYVCTCIHTSIRMYIHTYIVRVSGTVDLELQKLMFVLGYALPNSAVQRVCVLVNGLCACAWKMCF